MKKRMITLLLAGTLGMTMLAGCSNAEKDTAEATKTEASDGKKQITLMVDHDYRIDDIGNYLTEKYPDVDFDIVLGRTGVPYLKKAAENGTLPDIMISGSTWGRAGAELNEYLYDLSATDIASNFYTVYLDNYTTSDGKICWLPGCAAIEGIMANKTLFEENNIELPTDYASFVEVCNQFTELGIRPFASDYKYDYTDAYLLQALSIPLLQSEEGKSWRLSYEEGKTDTLDETIGLAMFEKLDSFFGLTGVTADDADRGYGATFGDLLDGNVAMIRQSTNNADYYDAGLSDLVILPYFGESEDESWYFTTPGYAVAMSGSLKDSEDEELCLDIVRSLFSQECMDIFAEEVQAFTAYNKGITFEVRDEFKNIVPYVESNHMYTYLLEDNFQAASKVAVQKMIAEDASPSDALDAFNEAVVIKEEDQQVVTRFENGYSRKWTENGNEAMSAVVNTLAEITDCDIMLAPATIHTSDVYQGDYTEVQLDNLLLGGGINFYKKVLTGAEVKNVIATAVAGGGTDYDPISLSTLPAVSGCKMMVSKTEDGTYQLDDLLVAGETIKEDAEYTFVYTDTSPAILRTAFGWNADEHDGQDIGVSEDVEAFDYDSYEGFVYPAEHVGVFWKTYFAEGGKILAPTEYIQVK